MRTPFFPRPGSASSCLLLALAAAGCATVDFDRPKPASAAIAPATDTHWGAVLAQLPPIEPGTSGFELLNDGVEALAARLVLAEDAERTIDAQYYLLHDDITGDLFLSELLNAADRGVRVRLLLDDVFTKGQTRRLSVLHAHPNFEVRIFNPFATRWFRYLRSACSFKRINRRMHNKSFTADNLLTVIGGRNIGDEYFGASADVNFGDLDLLCVGPVVEEVSAMFDVYWNDRLAVPVSVLADPPRDLERATHELRAELDQSDERARGTHYAHALDDSQQAILGKRAEDLEWCPYQLVYDPPAKGETTWSDDQESIMTPLRKAFDEMEQEIVVVSPYFVPRRSGVERFARARERGVEARVITNSLAANNHAIVHSGYAPYRRPLLDLGVELYEVRPDARITSGARRAGNERARSTLHTKAFFIDRRFLFVGSFNWDPRSAFINTEMGIFLDDVDLAEKLLRVVEASLPELTYRLEVDEGGGLQWYTLENGEEVEYGWEPATSCRSRCGRTRSSTGRCSSGRMATSPSRRWATWRPRG